MLSSSSPGSHLSKTNILAHANPLDRKNYPVLNAVFWGMTGLRVGVFDFFGLHTIVWLLRAVYVYLDQIQKGRQGEEFVRRNDRGSSSA